jgi:magnesium transporter
VNKIRYSKPGTAPATLVAPPHQEGQKPEVSLIEYDAHTILEKKVEQIDEVFPCLHNNKVSWININGLGDVDLLRKVGLHFRIHPLALEDMLNTGQRPKVDEYDNQLFIVLQMGYSTSEDDIVFEQVSLVLGPQFVITVQEEMGCDKRWDVTFSIPCGKGSGREAEMCAT